MDAPSRAPSMVTSARPTLAELQQAQQAQQLQVQHMQLVNIVGQLTELLPRIMPALTIKARLEVLPMVQAVVLAARDPDVQRSLVGLVFNGAATPDPAQRGAVIAVCAGVAAALGPAWAAGELLSMVLKQVSSPSAERRLLVADTVAGLLRGLPQEQQVRQRV